MPIFKFIHAAYLYLDSPFRGLSRYETEPVEAIRDACRKAFINMVDFAILEKIDFVLLAVDLYNRDAASLLGFNVNNKNPQAIVRSLLKMIF